MTRSDKTDNRKKLLLEALENSLGVVTNACKLTNTHRSTFYDYYNNDEEFKKSVDEIENVCIDFAETQLYKLIKDNNPAAIIFYMKTKGKNRGYIERQQIEHSGKVEVDTTINIKGSKSDLLSEIEL